MNTRLYVGNLDYSVTNEDLGELFADFGEVVSAEVITDRASGRSKGFGFVEMSSEEEAEAAMNALDGTEHDGRTIKVDEARPQTDR
ncbi:MAG: RNA recognition motif domain-containing protein [Patescibacteria group bacterium]